MSFFFCLLYKMTFPSASMGLFGILSHGLTFIVCNFDLCFQFYALISISCWFFFVFFRFFFFGIWRLIKLGFLLKCGSWYIKVWNAVYYGKSSFWFFFLINYWLHTMILNLFAWVFMIDFHSPRPVFPVIFKCTV